jgi:AcrR family transcriptional regulator
MAEVPSAGLRERKKAATRAALHEAALRLFAERGYSATTVADIAAAAGVSQRTFFRYFESKEDVALQDVTLLLPAFERVIRGRPAAEPPLRALRDAFLAVAGGAQAPQIALLYSGPPISWRSPLTLSRVRILTTLETSVAAALEARGGDAPEEADDGVRRADDAARYAAAVAARAAVAALRSALIRFHELGGGEAQPVSRFVELVREAFAVLEAR